MRELLGPPHQTLEPQDAASELHRFGVDSDALDGTTLAYHGFGVQAYVVLDAAGLVRRVVTIDDDTARSLDDRREQRNLQ